MPVTTRRRTAAAAPAPAPPQQAVVEAKDNRPIEEPEVTSIEKDLLLEQPNESPASDKTSTKENRPGKRKKIGNWKEPRAKLPSKRKDYDLGSCIGTKTFKSIVSILNSTQHLKTAPQRQASIEKLNDLYCKPARGDQTDYHKFFATCLWQSMCPIMQSDRNIYTDAIFKFFKVAVLKIGNNINESQKANEDLGSLKYHICHFIFRHHFDRFANVRVRIMELVRKILEDYQTDATVVDQFRSDLFERVVQLRIRDKVSSVRVATLHCLPFFKETIDARQVFMFELFYDQSPEARRVAVSLLPQFPSIKTAIYIRMAFDTSELVRTEAFLQISKLKLNRIAKKDEKYQLINCGLTKSRAGRTREVLRNNVLPEWLNECQNSLVELFSRLELAYHPKTARQIIDVLYPEGNSKEYYEIDWSFLHETEKVVNIEGMTLEKIQIWMLLCHKFKDSPFCANILLPEPSHVTKYLKELIRVLHKEKANEDEENYVPNSIISFAITLKLCEVLNFEEGSRREMIQLLKEFLLDPVIEDAIIINAAVDLAGKLVEKESLDAYCAGIITEFFDCTLNVDDEDDQINSLEDNEVADPHARIMGNVNQLEKENLAQHEERRLSTPVPIIVAEMEDANKQQVPTSRTSEDMEIDVQGSVSSLVVTENVQLTPMEIDVSRKSSVSTNESTIDTDPPHSPPKSEEAKPKSSVSSLAVHLPSHVLDQSTSVVPRSTGTPVNFPEAISPIPHPEKVGNALHAPGKNPFAFLSTSTPIRQKGISVSDKLTELKALMAEAIIERHRLVDKRDEATKNGQYLVCHEIHQQVEACAVKEKDLQLQILRLRDMEGDGYVNIDESQLSVPRGKSPSFTNDVAATSFASAAVVQASPELSQSINTEPSFLFPGHTILKALMIVLRFLGITKKITPFIRTLYQSHIIPCLEDEDARVRSYTISLYCLFGLTDKTQAKHSLLISLQALQFDVFDAQIAGFKAVVDLLIRYSLNFFQRQELEQSIDDVELPYPFDSAEICNADLEQGVANLLNKLGMEEPTDGDIELRITGIGKLFLTKRIKNTRILSDILAVWMEHGSTLVKDAIANFIQMFGMIDAVNACMVLESFLIWVNQLSESIENQEEEERVLDRIEDIMKLAEFVAQNTSPEALGRFPDGHVVHEQHIMNTLQHIKDILQADTVEILYLSRSLKYFTVSQVKIAQEIKKLITEILDNGLEHIVGALRVKKYFTEISKNLARKFGFELNILEDTDDEEREDAELGDLNDGLFIPLSTIQDLVNVNSIAIGENMETGSNNTVEATRSPSPVRDQTVG